MFESGVFNNQFRRQGNRATFTIIIDFPLHCWTMSKTAAADSKCRKLAIKRVIHVSAATDTIIFSKRWSLIHESANKVELAANESCVPCLYTHHQEKHVKISEIYQWRQISNQCIYYSIYGSDSTLSISVPSSTDVRLERSHWWHSCNPNGNKPARILTVQSHCLLLQHQTVYHSATIMLMKTIGG